MKNKGITFEKARSILKVFMAMAAALCILGLILNSSSETAALYATVGAIICMAVGLFVLLTFGKCPYCGRRIFRNCLVVKSCPHCHRDLVSGLKTKGKKKK